ncbi:MAG: M14 family metallopeptidase [Bacillota bacterium]
MAEELRVGPLAARRGEKVSGLLPVSGLEFQVPVTLVNGISEGKRVAVTGGIHGAEYPGIEAACRLAAALDPQAVKGSVVVVHVANPPAFFARSIYIGPMDGKNLNRVFPGDASGTASDRIAHTLFNDVILGSDYYVDLHGGDMIEKLIPFTIFCGDADPKVVETSKDMAAAYGIPYAVASSGAGGTYGTTARAGIPAILAEAGGMGILDEESVQMHLEGLESLLRYTGSIDSGVRLSAKGASEKKVTFLGSFPWLRSDSRGILYLNVDVGDSVEKGEHVGVIKDYFGNVLRELQAPATGIVLFRVTSPATNPTDPILAIGAE